MPKNKPPEIPSDMDLFRDAMRGVKQIAGDAKIRAPAKSKPQRILDSPSPKPDVHRQDGAEIIEGKNSGVDAATFEKFRRGEMPIAARLDLHGHTRDEAYAALSDFVARCYAEQKRCVLVITGKGAARPGDDFSAKMGVLRENFIGWVNQPGLRPKILAVSRAQGKHGGDGAFYVLIKRRK